MFFITHSNMCFASHFALVSVRKLGIMMPSTWNYLGVDNQNLGGSPLIHTY